MVNLCPDNLWFFASVEVVGPGGSVCSCLDTPVVRRCFISVSKGRSSIFPVGNDYC